MRDTLQANNQERFTIKDFNREIFASNNGSNTLEIDTFYVNIRKGNCNTPIKIFSITKKSIQKSAVNKFDRSVTADLEHR